MLTEMADGHLTARGTNHAIRGSAGPADIGQTPGDLAALLMRLADANQRMWSFNRNMATIAMRTRGLCPPTGGLGEPGEKIPEALIPQISIALTNLENLIQEAESIGTSFAAL